MSTIPISSSASSQLNPLEVSRSGAPAPGNICHAPQQPPVVTPKRSLSGKIFAPISRLIKSSTRNKSSKNTVLTNRDKDLSDLPMSTMTDASTQTDEDLPSLREKVMKQLPTLLPGLDLTHRHLAPLMSIFEHMIDMSRGEVSVKQNNELAAQYREKSRVAIPENSAMTHILNPYDFMLYVETVEKDGVEQEVVRVQELESNGSGYIGLTNNDPETQKLLWKATGDIVAGAYQEGDNPVVLVSVSGKENNDKPIPNKMVHEKVATTCVITAALEKKLGRQVQTHTLEDVRNNPDLINDGEPHVILGYTKHFTDDVQSGENNEATLFGRKVDGIHNDRLIKNLNVKFGDKLNIDSFKQFGPAWNSGQSKGLSYLIANTFRKTLKASFTERFPSLDHPIINTQVDAVYTDGKIDEAASLEAIFNVVQEMRDAGFPVILKPEGTGNGWGIRYCDLELNGLKVNDDEVKRQIIDSWKEVKKNYTAKDGTQTAGFPYTLAETLKSVEVISPGGMDGKSFELRLVTAQTEPGYLTTTPVNAKVNVTDGRVNNTTQQIAKPGTAPRGADAVIPLLAYPEQVQHELRCTPELLIELSRWASEKMAFTLEVMGIANRLAEARFAKSGVARGTGHNDILEALNQKCKEHGISPVSGDWREEIPAGTASSSH